MSIISSKAEHVYKSNTLMQEAYIAGASRQHTDEESPEYTPNPYRKENA